MPCAPQGLTIALATFTCHMTLGVCKSLRGGRQVRLGYKIKFC